MATAYVEIPLHSRKYPGLVALVNTDDYELASHFVWCPAKRGRTFYAVTNVRDHGTRSTILLHQMITGQRGIDHVDGNGLNNLRSNLRPANNHCNSANKPKRAGHSSKYKGVYRANRGKPWVARITVWYKGVWLGAFDSEVDAARAYDRAAQQNFGEFAWLNRDHFDLAA